jgi:hypothetical protein
MTHDRSRRGLLDFLDYLADKGLMAKATVAARKAAAAKVLSILSEDEAADVTRLNLDDVMRRFSNLQGRSYSPGSLSTYLSRLKSAVEDFSNYLENPLGFKPSAQPRERRKIDQRKEASAPLRSEEPASDRQPKGPLFSSILPIPIRPNITVFVQGIPYDLTEAEAAKIANVVRAMAMPI